MKTCGNCKRSLTHESFSKLRASHDGLQRFCKRCMNEYGAHFRKSGTRNMRFKNYGRGRFNSPRPLTEAEIDRLTAAVNRTPQQPIRLKVLA